MAKILTVDAETHDPYIDRKMGSGWVYKINVEDSDFEVLGFAFRTHDGEERYETNTKIIEEIVRSHDILVMHNAQYDIGCLHSIGIDVSKVTTYDTEVMSRLYDSSLISHALDTVAIRYLRRGKKNNALTDAIIKHDLYPYLKRELKAKEKAEKNGELYERTRPAENKLVKFAKNNMKLLQETDYKAMEEYAKGDISATYDLFRFFQDKIDMKLAKKYSMLAHICVQYRTKGVRIDIESAREARSKMIPVIKKAYDDVYKIAGREFNIDSPIEVPQVFDELGIKYPLKPPTELQKTKLLDKLEIAKSTGEDTSNILKKLKGNPTITKTWREKQSHPICQAINKAKEIFKIDRDFVQKIIEMQEFSCPEAYAGGRYGRVFPELNLLRARTGRFSCSGPNLQQIPSRGEYAPFVRDMFVPEEGEKWYSLDYANQEGRMQLHYAYRLGCEGAAAMREEYLNDPHFDQHTVIANIMGVDRGIAKGINHGICYGMGTPKLAVTLGCSLGQAELLVQKFKDTATFVVELDAKCKSSMKKKGYIKTIGGRHITLESSINVGGKNKTFEYKALNYLSQGSSLDQLVEAMIVAYQEDIPVLFPVHDQVCLSGTREQAIRMKEIMETCIDMTIPTVVDVDLEGGDSWEKAGH